MLTFDRAAPDGPGMRCTVNMTDAPVRADSPGELLVASGPIDFEGDEVVLPPDTTVWWSL